MLRHCYKQDASIIYVVFFISKHNDQHSDNGSAFATRQSRDMFEHHIIVLNK